MTSVLFLFSIFIFIFIFIIGLHFMFIDKSTPYLYKSDWSQIRNKPNFEKCEFIDGIEVRILPSSHLLSGQKGVFATKQFKQYDVIGEYTGIIRENEHCEENNLYIFDLVDEIVIDGQDCSNELKYVNSYINLADEPNLVSSNCYIDGLPKVLYVCSKDINVGEELLIDYGDSYNEAHILRS
jgi:hypothetical protein